MSSPFVAGAVAAAAAAAPSSSLQPGNPGARLGCGMHMYVGLVERLGEEKTKEKRRAVIRRGPNRRWRRSFFFTSPPLSPPPPPPPPPPKRKRQDLLPVHRPHPLVLELEDHRPGLLRCRAPRALCARGGAGGARRGEGGAGETAAVLPLRREGARGGGGKRDQREHRQRRGQPPRGAAAAASKRRRRRRSSSCCSCPPLLRRPSRSRRFRFRRSSFSSSVAAQDPGPAPQPLLRPPRRFFIPLLLPGRVRAALRCPRRGLVSVLKARERNDAFFSPRSKTPRCSLTPPFFSLLTFPPLHAKTKTDTCLCWPR